MISFLRGVLQSKQPPILIVELNGVGYECQASLSTFYQLPEVGHEVLLHTHFVVREDAHTLFAFFQERERILFRALIKINNVGPKLALAILSSVDPSQFVRDILEQDINALVNIPGVGKKTAELLIIGLRDRLKDWEFDTLPARELSAKEKNHLIVNDAVDALVALGFRSSEASRMIGNIKQDYRNTEELIRLALQRTLKGGKHDHTGSPDQHAIAE